MRAFPWIAVVVVLAAAGRSAAGEAWPADVPGHRPVQPGEHPRLFFRADQIPAIRKRAETAEGKAIVARLRFLLDGGDGTSLPAVWNSSVGKQAKDGSASNASQAPDGKAFTLWHAAGYGMLWQLTSDRRFADLGAQCLVKMLREKQRDRDNRYAFRAAHGALRAGPAVGAVGMAYDLLYDGLEPALRDEVVKAIQDYDEGAHMSIAELARGARHGPHSNHFGPQVGGAALALLAIRGDPGADESRIAALLEANAKAMIRAVTEGSGDGGVFIEGKGAGGINTDTALVPAFQAWKVAAGKDFIGPRPNVAGINVIKLHELITIKGSPWYPISRPNSYGTGNFAMPSPDGGGPQVDRGGLSRGGQFSQGFGIMPEPLVPAMLWVYDNVVERDAAKRSFDTVGPYPHRAVMALINWPIGVKPVNPAEVLPKVHGDTERRYYAFRNQWTGTEEDILVCVPFGFRDPHQLKIWGKGAKLHPMMLPQTAPTHFQPAEDGSGTISAGGLAIGVDFSKASGAEALVVVVGGSPKGGQAVQAGSTTFHLFAIGGTAAAAQARGGKVVIGGQGIAHDGSKIVFDTMAGPPKLPRLGLWR